MATFLLSDSTQFDSATNSPLLLCSPQESSYNIGRAAHQLGLLHIAAAYYERSLQASPSAAQSAAACRGGGSERLSLQREAAYNLSLIYRSSGSEDLARQLLRQYVTI